jgi:hypothetical protein
MVEGRRSHLATYAALKDNGNLDAIGKLLSMNSQNAGLNWSGQVGVNPIPNPIPDPLSTSDDAQNSPPKTCRGRPVSSLKVKRPEIIHVIPMDRRPRGAGRSSGASRKAPRHKHGDKAKAALGTRHNEARPAKVAVSLHLPQSRTPQHSNTFTATENPDTEVHPVVAPVPEVLYTHDFSIISLIEMRRLAAACVASVMRKSSEDQRFVAYSASLQAVSAELEARALTPGALDGCLWHS